MSSPADQGTDAAFVLQELTACWDQSYEALARGDLDQVKALMQIADDQLAAIDPVTASDPELSAFRREADAARGRLEHGMKAGLEGLRAELRQAREGARALSGYRNTAQDVGGRIERDI